MHQLVFAMSPTMQCILTQPNDEGCFQPLIYSQRHDSLSYIMLRPRLFSLTGEFRGGSYGLRQYARSHTYLHIDSRLLSL